MNNDLSELKPDEGKIIEVNGEKIGVYKDPEGKIHAVSPNCTFEGCPLTWNPDERNWYCSCCGSKFSFDGKVLHGPATRDLPKISL